MVDTSAGTPANLSPRARARVQTMRDIVRIGREHLATEGAAALSLRAVARDLGLVSSAVYRYVASRDELLTLLVVDGYDELGDAVDAALEPVDRDDHVGRVVAIARATRAWALAEPATYALLFGSPVPGYEAPAEQTTGPGTRVVGRLVEVWEDAWQAGAISLDEAPLAPRRLSRDLARIRKRGGHHRPRPSRRPRALRLGGALRVRVVRGVRAVRRRHLQRPPRPLRAPPRGAGRGGRAPAVLSQRASARPTARPEKMQPPRKVPSSAL